MKKWKAFIEQNSVTPVQNIKSNITSLLVFSNHACRLPSKWCNLEDWIALFADLAIKISNYLESYLTTPPSIQKSPQNVAFDTLEFYLIYLNVYSVCESVIKLYMKWHWV